MTRRLTLLACAPILAALPLGIAWTSPGGGPHCKAGASVATGEFDEFHRELFGAVLEGLFEDGVSSEVARRVVAVDEESKYPANFVQGCPICMPALDAFRLYLARPVFHASKTESDTFGAGLDEDARAKLLGPDADARRKQIQVLIERWVERRMQRLRLDSAERQRWRQAMEERRKKGMSMLQQLREGGVAAYVDMKECALCEGAAGAAR